MVLVTAETRTSEASGHLCPHHLSQEAWSSRFDCLVPKTIRKVYPDLLAFTKDWQTTAQVPY
jgi:hypothetical protein